MQNKAGRHQRQRHTLTSHSLCPWNPSWLSFLTAMTIPVPGLVGAKVFASIHPLNTEPKPPSPRTLSGRKFRVEVLSSLKVKLLTLADCRISSSLRGVAGLELGMDNAAETRLLLECCDALRVRPPAFRPPPRLAHCLLLLLEPAAYASIIQNFRQAFDRSVCNNIDCYMMHACQEEIKQLSFLSACVCLYGQN